MIRLISCLAASLSLSLAALPASAAGTLKPVDVGAQPVEIVDHQVHVVINNGFARTEVLQTFYNPNDADLEAIYSFPLPLHSSLSETSITSGELQIHGEVLERDEAERIYEHERSLGRDAGLSSKNDFYSYEFRVAPVRASSQVTIRFVYYQPIAIDTSVGRYLYPLEEGGTDEAAKSFWLSNESVNGSLTLDLELRSAWPVDDVRFPGFENDAIVDQLGDGHYRAHIELASASLDRDFVFYYKLSEDLPGRVELLSNRSGADESGTFMLVLTPGLDLQPLDRGADYTFVLDLSGSMEGKVHTLSRAVSRSIGELRPDDRFRIVTFSDRARLLTAGWVPATENGVDRAIAAVERLRAQGSTNLYEGLELALDGLDDDRTSSVILVTDAVTNTGVVDPKAFHQLMQRVDVRVFGFLLGNGVNFPLMKTICDSSGGFYAQVSNQDDLFGQVLLAKSKITYEALHDVELEIDGVEAYAVTDNANGKIYRGQQVTVFGRYDQPGTADLRLRARKTGQDLVYETTIELPEQADDHPELERLWALARIEETSRLRDAGMLANEEARPVIVDLALSYQLVTDHTSMVVLTEEAFREHGIERRNRQRVRSEHAAQARRANAPIQNHRADGHRPAFHHRAPSPSSGGGAIDPWTLLLILGFGGVALWATTRGR